MATHMIDRIVDANGNEYVFSDSSKAEAGTASPLMDGKASVGNSLKYAREDHVHPSDTSREDIANKTTVVLGTSDSKYPTDKAVAEFVNSSIATNTANYISNNGEPFTSVEQLEAYSGPVTNNDYAFVTGIDSEGNTYYDRYKATVSGSTVTWALEYRLNNSSFTAAQWSAINSGITSVLVAKIHDHSNKDVLDGITSDKVNSWDAKEDAFDILPTTKGGTGTNAASKSALTSSLINSLSTAYANAPDDADYYVGQALGGGTSNTSFVRRPVLALWEYIKNKISSVLGLTDSAYSGKAATAGTADKAVSDHSGNNIEETYATKTELSTHKGDTTVHITAAERTEWNAKASTSVATTSTNGLMSAADKTKLNGIATGAEANVQADWNETNHSSDAFIRNKPYFNKNSGSTDMKFKVCQLLKASITGTGSDGIEVFYRRGDGAVHGHLLHKAKFELYLEHIGDVSINKNTVKFYYVENSSTVDIYAEINKYCQLIAAPLANILKDRIDFSNFGTSVDSIPEGAVAINPVWVANSSASSGTAPVKVDDYGNLTAVPMDSTPTASSTNLMTSGGIKTALDLKANDSDLTAHKGDTTVHITAAERKAWNAKQSALSFDTTPTAGSTNPVTSEGIKTALEVLQSNINTVDAKGIVINEINGENVICFE